jgi:RHS repeat-associated protein
MSLRVFRFRHICMSLTLLLLLVAGRPVVAAEWVEMESATTNRLWAVWGSSPEDVFAVGDFGTILHFDGKSWAEMDSGVDGHLYGIYGYGPNDVYAVGALGAAVLHYDGGSWSTVSIETGDPTFPPSPVLRDVWTLGGSGELYLYGYRTALRYNPATQIWTRLAFTEGINRSALPNAAFTGVTGYLEGTTVRTISSSNGISNTQVGLFVFGTRIDSLWSLHALWTVAPDDIYAVGSGGGVRFQGGNPRTRNDWLPFSLSDPTSTMSFGFDVWAADASNVVVVGQTFSGVGAIAFYDGNLDNDWQIVKAVPLPLRSVFGFGPQDVFTVGDNGAIFRLFEPGAPATAANFPYSAEANPFVNAFTGELIIPVVDIDLGGPLPLAFKRTYVSGLKADAIVNTGLGNNWTHNFNWRFTSGNSNGTDIVKITSHLGQVIEFRQEEVGVWTQASALYNVYSLEEGAGKFTLFDIKSEMIMQFDATSGSLEFIRDRRGNQLTRFGVSGGVTRIVDGKGRQLDLSYEDGNITKLVYSGNEFDGSALKQVTREVLFAYDEDQNLVSSTDQANFTTQYSYDAADPGAGLLTGIMRPEGNSPYLWTYDEEGRVATQPMADGTLERFEYGSVTRISLPGGATRSYAHNDKGQVLVETDEQGRSTTYTYDDAGRRASMTDRQGATLSWVWHAASGKLSSETEQAIGSTQYTYVPEMGPDGRTYFNNSRIGFVGGASVSFDYDPSGNGVMTAWTRPGVGTTRYESDVSGNMTRLINPGGGDFTYTYESRGNLFTTKTNYGTEVTTLVDGFGNKYLDIFTGEANTRRSSVYDSRDLLIRTVDEDGYEVRYYYDGNARLTTIEAPEGLRSEFTYDSMDRLQRYDEGDPAIAYKLAYDERGALKSVNNFLGDIREFSYSAAGNPLSVTENGSRTWQASYNPEAIVTSLTLPSGKNITSMLRTDNTGKPDSLADAETEIKFNYDASKRLTSLSDGSDAKMAEISLDAEGFANGSSVFDGAATTEYQHSWFGSPTQVTDPAGYNWRFERNGQDQVTQTTDPLENTYSMLYDTRGRVSQITYPGGLGSLQLGRNGRGNITTLAYSDGVTLNFAYDGLSSVQSGTGFTTTRSNHGVITESNNIINRYDIGDRLREIDYGDGRVIRYTYNSAGEVESVTDWLSGTAIVFAYDIDGKAQSIQRSSGTGTAYGYDAAGRLTSIDHDGLATISLTLDALGRTLSADKQLPIERSIQVKQVDGYSHDAANQIEGETYDARGFPASDGGKVLSWDLAGHLKQIAGTVSATYQYDGLGMRTEDDASVYTWNYALKLPSPGVIQPKDITQPPQYYVHLPNGQLLYRVVDDQREFYHFDESGNTIALTDGSGSLLNAYALSPYGEVLQKTGSKTNCFVWGGQWGIMRDATGYYYVRSRYYDPKSARFLSRDAFVSLSPLSTSPYQYALGNPVKFTDPTGFNPQLPKPNEGSGDSTRSISNVHRFGAAALSLEINLIDLFVKTENIGTWKNIWALGHARTASRAFLRGTSYALDSPGVFSSKVANSAAMRFYDKKISGQWSLRQSGKGASKALAGLGGVVSFVTEKADRYSSTTAGNLGGRTGVAVVDILSGPITAVSEIVDVAVDYGLGEDGGFGAASATYQAAPRAAVAFNETAYNYASSYLGLASMSGAEADAPLRRYVQDQKSRGWLPRLGASIGEFLGDNSLTDLVVSSLTSELYRSWYLEYQISKAKAKRQETIQAEESRAVDTNLGSHVVVP